MMLPPVGSTTLSANPKFETLYRDLCTNKLNTDGSSVLDAKVQKERDIFATVSGEYSSLYFEEWSFIRLRPYNPILVLAKSAYLRNMGFLLTHCAQDLRIARLEGAKRNLIRSELRVISSDSTSLPDDVSPSRYLTEVLSDTTSSKSLWP